jgi:hypothetical protein
MMFIFVLHNGTGTWFDIEDDTSFLFVRSEFGEEVDLDSAMHNDIDGEMLALSGDEVYRILRAHQINTGMVDPDDWTL